MNARLNEQQAIALRGGAPASSIRALGADPYEVIKQRISVCERDIRKAALSIIEEALPFAQSPESQESKYAQDRVHELVHLAIKLQTCVDALKDNHDEMDAL